MRTLGNIVVGNIVEGAGGGNRTATSGAELRRADGCAYPRVQPNLFAFCQNQEDQHRGDVCNGEA